MNNPNFNVRFYVRTTKTQGGDSPTPLRAKVWISATKQYVYFSTNATTTKRKWADFATDGTPSPGADPDLVKIVDAYKAAAHLVLAGAAANNRIHLLTSDELNVRINAVVTCMEKRQRESSPRPILVYTTPRNVPTCADCEFKADCRCSAPWKDTMSADVASDLALYNGKCPMHKLTPTTDENFFSRFLMEALFIKSNNPDMSMEDAVKTLQNKYIEYIHATRKQSEEGGNV